MAGSAGNSDDDIVATINVTPLVDIMLVLLIIFVVTAKIIVSQTIPMDLPKGQSGGPAQQVFTVSITKEGVVIVDKKTMATDEELRKLAGDALAKDHDLRTVIQAATQVQHGQFVHVLDQLRIAGITKIGIAIDKTTTVSGTTATPHP
jgi:biopolymer transport protein ExbD